MALPQQVIESLSREPAETPGWSFGLLMLSGGIFLLALLIYFGLTFGYEPYINTQISQLNLKLSTLSKSISADDQAKFSVFYSEITNIKTTLQSHVSFSRFLLWLSKNTEANVYYSHLSFSSGNQVLLTGLAPSEADVNTPFLAVGYGRQDAADGRRIVDDQYADPAHDLPLGFLRYVV